MRERVPLLGNYVHAKRVGNLLYLSGKGPESASGAMPRGKIGAGMSIEETAPYGMNDNFA